MPPAPNTAILTPASLARPPGPASVARRSVTRGSCVEKDRLLVETTTRRAANMVGYRLLCDFPLGTLTDFFCLLGIKIVNLLALGIRVRPFTSHFLILSWKEKVTERKRTTSRTLSSNKTLFHPSVATTIRLVSFTILSICSFVSRCFAFLLQPQH